MTSMVDGYLAPRVNPMDGASDIPYGPSQSMTSLLTWCGTLLDLQLSSSQPLVVLTLKEYVGFPNLKCGIERLERLDGTRLAKGPDTFARGNEHVPFRRRGVDLSDALHGPSISFPCQTLHSNVNEFDVSSADIVVAGEAVKGLLGEAFRPVPVAVNGAFDGAGRVNEDVFDGGKVI